MVDGGVTEIQYDYILCGEKKGMKAYRNSEGGTEERAASIMRKLRWHLVSMTALFERAPVVWGCSIPVGVIVVSGGDKEIKLVCIGTKDLCSSVVAHGGEFGPRVCGHDEC